MHNDRLNYVSYPGTCFISVERYLLASDGEKNKATLPYCPTPVSFKSDLFRKKMEKTDIEQLLLLGSPMTFCSFKAH